MSWQEDWKFLDLLAAREDLKVRSWYTVHTIIGGAYYTCNLCNKLINDGLDNHCSFHIKNHKLKAFM